MKRTWSNIRIDEIATIESIVNALSFEERLLSSKNETLMIMETPIQKRCPSFQTQDRALKAISKDIATTKEKLIKEKHKALDTKTKKPILTKKGSKVGSKVVNTLVKKPPLST
jgi:hypothetical protein